MENVLTLAAMYQVSVLLSTHSLTHSLHLMPVQTMIACVMFGWACISHMHRAFHIVHAVYKIIKGKLPHANCVHHLVMATPLRLAPYEVK